MKLYYSPGACSLAPHIVLCELGIPYEKERVDLGAKKTENGSNYYDINPKGSVPALKMDNGEVLTEASVICRYIADQKPETNLSVKGHSLDYYRFIEWLNFIGTEVHKTLGLMFGAQRFMKTDTGREEFIAAMKGIFETKLKIIEHKLEGHDYVMGKQFTFADAYLFTVLNWTNFLKIDVSGYKNVHNYMARVAARPGVQRAMKEEGLLK